MSTRGLVARLRDSDGFRTFTAGDGHPSICADTDLMREAADRIEELERVLSLIAFCDTPEHADYESHGLYRSMMILMAKNALQ